MIISVTLKPSSRQREEVALNDDGSLTVFTKASVVGGKANEVAMRLLAKYYGVSKTRVRLVRGLLRGIGYLRLTNHGN